MMSPEQKRLATDALCEVAEALRLAVSAAQALDSARAKMDTVVAGMAPWGDEGKRAERFSLAVTRASLMMGETIRTMPEAVDLYARMGVAAGAPGAVSTLAQLTQEIVTGAAVPA
jgi:hypothetical protein